MKSENQQIREIVLLLILILCAGITLTILKNPADDSPLPDWALPAWDDLRVIRLERPLAEETVLELEREDRGWMIQPLNRLAGEEELLSLQTQLSSLQAVDLIAEKGPYERFGLDERQQIKLILKSEDRRVVLLVGSPTPSGNYNYIRFEGDQAVYTARGPLQKLLLRPASSYRSRQVLSFNPGEIESLELSRKRDSRVLFRRGEEWWDSNGVIPKSAELAAYIKRFSQLKCLSYLSEKESLPLTSQPPLFSLRLKSDETYRDLNILKENEKSYVAETEGVEDAFLISRYDGDFLKRLSGF